MYNATTATVACGYWNENEVCTVKARASAWQAHLLKIPEKGGDEALGGIDKSADVLSTLRTKAFDACINVSLLHKADEHQEGDVMK